MFALKGKDRARGGYDGVLALFRLRGMGRLTNKGKLKAGNAAMTYYRHTECRFRDHHLRNRNIEFSNPAGKGRRAGRSILFINGCTDQEVGARQLTSGLKVLD